MGETTSKKLFEGEDIFYLNIPQSARIKSASIKVKGSAFAGNIVGSYGTTRLDAAGKVSQITIDFHSMRTINRLVLEVDEASPQKCELKVWGGMSWFLPGPEYRFAFNNKKIDTTFAEITTQKILLNFINIAASTAQTATVTTTPASETEPEKLSVAVGDINSGISPVLAKITKLEVYALSFPSNVLIGLKDMSPLLVYPGVLSTTVSIPDCTKELNEYLQTCQIDVSGVPLVIHTDTLGQIELIEEAVNYNTITSDNIIEGQKEKSLEFIGKEEKKLTINIPIKTQITSLTMDIEGDFAKEMISDASGHTDTNTGIMICSEYTISQQILLEEELSIVGIALYLAKLTPEAKLKIEIRSGTNQEPSRTTLACTEIQVKENEFAWILAQFAKPITLLKENNYWIVLNAISGELEWRTDPQKPYNGSLILSKDKGVFWIKNERMNALFQLVFIPEASVSPIGLQIDNNKVDLWTSTELAKFTFTQELLNAANKCLTLADNLTLTFQSKTSGILKISNMLIEVEEH